MTKVKFRTYDGDECVADVDASGNPLRSYTWGLGFDDLLAVTVYTNNGGTTSVSSVYYAVKDHLGSVRALIDVSGNTAASYTYDAWGNVQSATGNGQSAIGNRYLFQGREYSFVTGLYNFRARWYAPELGRWLSNDPIGISGGLNLYEFCGNNPVNFLDPWGLRFASQDEAAKAGIDNLYKTQPNADRWEYAFDIYRKPDGSYDYGPYHTDELPTDVNGVLFTLSIDSGQYETEDCEKNNQPFEGNVHTHTRQEAAPSKKDKRHIPDLSRLTGKPFYIGNRWGDVNKFNPQKGKTGGWEWIRREK